MDAADLKLDEGIILEGEALGRMFKRGFQDAVHAAEKKVVQALGALRLPEDFAWQMVGKRIKKILETRFYNRVFLDKEACVSSMGRERLAKVIVHPVDPPRVVWNLGLLADRGTSRSEMDTLAEQALG
ncbi:unnamed protein product, partial [Prorocentrum cordatum]